jgi:hypothetical protein
MGRTGPNRSPNREAAGSSGRRMSSILVVTDAWHPQINGVVRSLERTADELRAMGVRMEFLTPQAFKTLPCPTYPEIRLSLTHKGTVRRMMDEFDCEHLHIATEGPLGLLAAGIAKKRGQPFTTSYHTRFPEYVSARMPVPLVLVLCLDAPLPQRRQRLHGGNDFAGERPERPRLPELDALVARGRRKPLQALRGLCPAAGFAWAGLHVCGPRCD